MFKLTKEQNRNADSIWLAIILLGTNLFMSEVVVFWVKASNSISWSHKMTTAFLTSRGSKVPNFVKLVFHCDLCLNLYDHIPAVSYPQAANIQTFLSQNLPMESTFKINFIL